jgi:pyruvate dehydrogenase (quinone)
MIARALEQNGPALAEVLVDRHELSMPPTITLGQLKDFGLFAPSTCLSDR